jgi:AcrR family transcriptional regulator
MFASALEVSLTEEKLERRIPQQARSRERHTLILESAARLFAEVGYETATTNAIAKEAGVPIGSLYQYFSSKEAVLHALADRYLEDMRQLQENVFGPDEGDASIEEMVDRQIDPFVAFFEKHPGFEHIFLGSEVSSDLAAAAEHLEGAVLEGIKSSLQQRNRQLGDERAFLAATVVKGMVKGLFGLLKANADPAFQADIMAEFKRTLADYVRGVVDGNE